MAAPYPTGAAASRYAAPSAPPASSAPYPDTRATPASAAPDASEYHTPVQLFISCTKLQDKDVLSKSDPICVVDMLQGTTDPRRGQFHEIGRTEWIQDNLNPEFARSITVAYYFEEVQHLKFTLYDVDDVKQDVRRGGGELLGEALTQLSQIMTKSPFEMNLSYEGKTSGYGKIKIIAEQVSSKRETITMSWSATKVDKMDFFGKSDPFLEFARENTDGSFAVAHRTEVIKNTLDPTWKQFQVSSQQLCNSDDRRKIRIQCQDWNKNGSADFIGAVDTTLGELRSLRIPHSMDLINPSKKAKKKSYKNSGTLHLRSLEIVQDHTFLDYLRSGLELNFVVGVDFTGSNGNPQKPSSLHYLSPNGQMNEYQRALWAVGSVCEQYDTDKMFPAYGFGAKVPPNYEFSSIFNLGVGSGQPECHGVSGILAAYQQAITQVQLWGPTNAAPIITTVASIAEEEHMQLQREKRPCQVYQILLLLTDGILTDMDQTKLAVIRASRLPMSIIIVGVGSADFSDMDVLDADDDLLRHGSHVAFRDIVQFVPFSKFANQPPERLAKEVLEEVPGQVVDYMRAYKVPIAST